MRLAFSVRVFARGATCVAGGSAACLKCCVCVRDFRYLAHAQALELAEGVLETRRALRADEGSGVGGQRGAPPALLPPAQAAADGGEDSGGAGAAGGEKAKRTGRLDGAHPFDMDFFHAPPCLLAALLLPVHIF